MTRKKILLSTLAFFVAGFSPLMRPFPGVIVAEEIVITGNGSESANAVSNTSQSEANVQQSNKSETTNTVNVNADTGNNEASKNTGEVAIQTGDATSTTQVENQGNISVVDTSGCCPTGEKSIVVSGNGSGSSNSVDVAHKTVITTGSTQTATITNTISGNVNTGGNIANDTSGDVVIITGNILHKEFLRNGPINQSFVHVGLPQSGYKVNVSGNGVYSNNTVAVNEKALHQSYIFNTANIFNTSFWDLMTGGNIANRNNGDVLIKTGNIVSEVSIVNNANTSVVKEDCCKIKPSEIPPTPTPPTQSPGENKPGNGGSGGGGNGGGSSGSTGASSGPAGGHILPVTGADWVMIAILGNILLLLFGVMLRLRSGRSPGFRYNFVI